MENSKLVFPSLIIIRKHIIILTVTISFFTLISSCVKINTLYDNYEQLEEKVLILEGEK